MREERRLSGVGGADHAQGGVDVGFRDQQFCQSESVAAVSLDLRVSNQAEAERVSQAYLKAESLKTINEPVPVEGALNDDLQVWSRSRPR